MAAPRSIQFIALRNLSRHGQQQTRRLSMTGPEYASRVLTKEPSTRKAAVAAATSLSEKKMVESKQAPPTTRHFNTSRTLKAPNDTSTIDFTFLPTPSTLSAPADIQIRVPILPTTLTPTPKPISEPETLVMKPTISSMSADTVYLPMAEMSDGHAMNIDFHAMADRVAANLRRMSVPVEEQAGIIKQVWSDMVDDVLGGGGKNVVAA